jgi:hypothetical protein
MPGLRPLPRRPLAGQFVGEVPAVDGADTVDRVLDHVVLGLDDLREPDESTPWPTQPTW